MDPKKSGAPGRSRTSDRLVRSQVLYPAELRARNSEKRGDSRDYLKSGQAQSGGEGGIRTLDGV